MNEHKHELQVDGLKVLTTGLNLAELDLQGGDGLWPEVRRYVKESRLENLVDVCLDGRAAPRIWAILEAPGAGPAAAAAGLGVSMVLADRGQAVVLLDADEQEPRVTRWLGRTEQEGWIDMVRFGASLHAASDPLPSDNRRGSVVGVGSFAPTGVTPEEVSDLLGRLRHQADDLVLVLPAKLRSQPWLAEAQIRLLCWDLLGRSQGDTQTIVSELDRMAGRPTAILGFGVEEFQTIDQRLSEGIPTPEPEPDPEAETVRDATPIQAEEPRTEPVAPEEPVEEEPEPEPVPAPEPEPMPDETDAPSEPEAQGEEPPTGRRTSGIFVFVAVAAAACLALVAWFFWDQIMGTDDQSVAQQAAPPPPVVTMAEPEDEAPVAEPVAQPADDPADQPDLQPEAGPAEGDEVVLTDHDDQPLDSDPVQAEAVVQETEPTVTEPEPAPEPEPERPAFDRAPFREPVGDAGWSVWLYSLPDEDLAVAELRELERRGLVAEYRAVEIKDKGRWYRVYTGSFQTRAEANRAIEGLKAYLRTDWAVPARF